VSATSSAIPQNLIRFGEQAAEIDDHLPALAGPLQDALDAFRATGSEFAPPIPEVDETLRQLARRGRAMDDRVVFIGRAFRDAAHGRLARPLSVTDALLLPRVPPRGAPLVAHVGGDILEHIREIAEWIRDHAGPAGPPA